MPHMRCRKLFFSGVSPADARVGAGEGSRDACGNERSRGLRTVVEQCSAGAQVSPQRDRVADIEILGYGARCVQSKAGRCSANTGRRVRSGCWEVEGSVPAKNSGAVGSRVTCGVAFADLDPVGGLSAKSMLDGAQQRESSIPRECEVT